MSIAAQGSQPNKWTTLTPLQARYPCRNPVCVGKSIWISTDYHDGERGMVEVDCGSNTIKQTVKYPKGFQLWGHSVCGSEGDGIVIVDGRNGKLIEFNPKNKKYGAVVSIPKFGWNTSSIMINGNVHIIHGYNNSTNRYLIYSVETGKVKEFKDNLESSRMDDVSITKTDNGQFIKFGGRDCDQNECVDTLYVGTVHDEEWINSNIYVPLKSALDKLAKIALSQYDTGIIGLIVDYAHCDGQRPMKWNKSREWKMKRAVFGCGVINKGPFVVMFGGKSNSGFSDEIYILDIRSKSGWIQSPIKCPMESNYVAALDHQQRVHLFTFYNDDAKHYSIALQDIVPELAISAMAQRVRPNQQNDDEKGGIEEESAKLGICSDVQ